MEYQEFRENFNRVIKYNKEPSIPEKSTEMKNTLEGSNSRLVTREE